MLSFYSAIFNLIFFIMALDCLKILNDYLIPN